MIIKDKYGREKEIDLNKITLFDDYETEFEMIKCDIPGLRGSSFIKYKIINEEKTIEVSKETYYELFKMKEEKKMFKNIKEKDRVWDFVYGWGTVTNFFKNNNILVGFEVTFDKESIKQKYDLNGIILYTIKNQTLFWNEIKFELPEKPFNLEDELRKLEIVEFKLEKDNYFLVWSNKLKHIDNDYLSSYQNPFLICFTEKSINNFMDNIKDKEITKEQFFTAYKNVFGEAK